MNARHVQVTRYANKNDMIVLSSAGLFSVLLGIIGTCAADSARRPNQVDHAPPWGAVSH